MKLAIWWTVFLLLFGPPMLLTLIWACLLTACQKLLHGKILV